MKIGIALTTSVSPALTEPAQTAYVTRLATVTEEVGFDSVWVSDRTVYPHDLAARHPDRFGPGQANPAAQNVLEALTTLSFVAAVTSSVRLGLSVLVLPFREPVLTAKMIATLDVLSGGRVICGVGVGWMPEEFAAMRANYSARGAVTDEQIELFKALWTQDVPAHHGEHYAMEGMTFFPKPQQQPHPPLWIGGNSHAALRRTARLGNGWHGIRLTPAELATMRATLGDLCRQHGRDPDDVTVSLRMTLALDETHHTSAGARMPLTGAPAQIADDLRRYRDAHLDCLVLSVAGPDTDSTVAAVRRFADEVVPQMG